MLQLPAVLGHEHHGNEAQGQSRGLESGLDTGLDPALDPGVLPPPESLYVGVQVVVHWVGCGMAGERSSRSNTGLGVGGKDLHVKH